MNELGPAFQKYNEEQFATVKLPGGSRQVIISSHSSLGDGRYYDVESSSSFAFDHATQVSGAFEPGKGRYGIGNVMLIRWCDTESKRSSKLCARRGSGGSSVSLWHEFFSWAASCHNGFLCLGIGEYA